MKNNIIPNNSQEYLKTAALWNDRDVYTVFCIGVILGTILGVILYV